MAARSSGQPPPGVIKPREDAPKLLGIFHRDDGAAILPIVPEHDRVTPLRPGITEGHCCLRLRLLAGQGNHSGVLRAMVQRQGAAAGRSASADQGVKLNYVF